MNKYRLFRRNTHNGYKERVSSTNNINDAMDRIMNNVFSWCGNGDGENGGEGSLWRCAKDIYDCLRNGGHYFYGVSEWWIEGINEPDPKKFRFRFSTILDSSVVMEGATYEEAKAKSKEWADEQIKKITAIFSDKDNPWKCCGSWNDEGDEEVNA